MLVAHLNQNSVPKPERRPAPEESGISCQEPHTLKSRARHGGRQRGRQHSEPRTGPQKCQRTLLEMVRKATNRIQVIFS